MGKVNADQICEVRILNHTPHPHIEYKEAKRSFWMKREAGFYNTLSIFGEEIMTIEEIEKDGQLVCIEKQAFWRPRIFIKMSNGDKRYMYFKTIDEAKLRFEQDPNFKGVKWIDDVYE